MLLLPQPPLKQQQLPPQLLWTMILGVVAVGAAAADCAWSALLSPRHAYPSWAVAALDMHAVSVDMPEEAAAVLADVDKAGNVP